MLASSPNAASLAASVPPAEWTATQMSGGSRRLHLVRISSTLGSLAPATEARASPQLPPRCRLISDWRVSANNGKEWPYASSQEDPRAGTQRISGFLPRGATDLTPGCHGQL